MTIHCRIHPNYGSLNHCPILQLNGDLLAVELLQQLHDVMAARRIEVSRRFIGQQHLGFRYNGAGNGLLLRLDAHGRTQLEAATRMNQGSLMLSVVNGVPVDVTQIDRPIADGMFTIWQGVSDETIALMAKKLPHVSSNSQSSERLDMTPSTTKEKKEARKAELEMKKYNEDMARRAERGEDISAPRTKEIPLE